MTVLRRVVHLLALAALLAAPLPLHAAEALTPLRVIYPGQAVSADMVEAVELRRGVEPPQAVAVAPEEVEGKVAKRTLVPGRLIPLSALREPWAVEAGKPVEAVFAKGGLSISITATALQSAVVGEAIRLRNTDSGKMFSGVVRGDGRVEVAAP